MKRAIRGAAFALGLVSVGCGAASQDRRANAPAPVTEVERATAAQRFAEGLAAMARHDRDGDWTEARCKDTAALFLEARAGGGAAPSYNAGLAYQRCKLDRDARSAFREALEKAPAFPPARAALALYDGEAGGPARDRAITELQAIVVESRFSNVDALVRLATLQIQRGGGAADADGADDFERAKRNLHRALSIDDGFMPALNQLAIHHLEAARRGARARGAQGKKGDVQALDLAALVCAQAIRKNGKYAPIHNTAGLVDVELGNLSRAAASFDAARRLDPAFFEAHLNYAAVNLAFRGFAQAEEAYRAALAVRDRDYDARLGLALAIRGQIDAGSADDRVAAALKELRAAQQIAPDRPEAYYNEAILAQEYGGRAGGKAALEALDRASALFQTFLTKAGQAPELAEARKRAADRMQEIAQVRGFIMGAPAQDRVPGTG